MTKIILLRHGLSVYNKADIFSGQGNPPLDEIGIAQAELAGKFIIENFPPDIIYASELYRTHQTANPVAKALGLKINVEKAFNELNIGPCDGMYREDVRKTYPGLLEKYKEDPDECTFPNGESYSDLRKRAMPALMKIVEENAGKTVLISTHGGVIRCLSCKLKGLKYSELTMLHNASVTVINFDNDKIDFELLDYNDYLNEKE